MDARGDGHSRSLISLSMSSTRDTTSRNSAGLNPVVSRADRFLNGTMLLVGVEEDEGADSGTAVGPCQSRVFVDALGDRYYYSLLSPHTAYFFDALGERSFFFYRPLLQSRSRTLLTHWASDPDSNSDMHALCKIYDILSNELRYRITRYPYFSDEPRKYSLLHN